jgi:uncharacterized protein
LTEYKILFSGTAGAGKTTAIGVVSDIVPLGTDVKNSDSDLSKNMTTVGLDYGEISLGDIYKLRLYGTPGQKRFDFMWRILGRGALGLIILIDNRRSDPLADLDMYLDGFAELITDTACVLAVGRMDERPIPDIEHFAEHLELRGILCPVLPIDVRDRAQVVQLLELLLLQLDVNTTHEQTCDNMD